MKDDPANDDEFDLLRTVLEKVKPKRALLFAMLWARRGDWEPLAVYLELGGHLSEHARAFLAAVLRGKKRPNNRAKTGVASLTSFIRALSVTEEERRGEKRERAINKAADEFEVDRRTIQRDLKEWGDEAATLTRHFLS
jgi:hypothetical protein